jgi:hypothetical protein
MRLLISVASFLFCLFASGESANVKRTVPKGFVTTRGAEFELDGSPLAFVGANSYVSGFSDSSIIAGSEKLEVVTPSDFD